jgi:hypothetical protein
MRLPKLLVYFETSPAVSLLRSPNAPYLLDFLDRTFKQPGRIAMPHSELLAALHAYQEDLSETDPGKLPSRAETYLSDWSSSETRWLRRLLEGGSPEPVYQLTPQTEDVFAFLDRVLEKEVGFIGTESRLKLVIETLADLVVKASDDPQARLEHLRQEERQLREEIARIEEDGHVSRYRPAQIRERFLTAVSLLKQLQGDFRAVEESFQSITAQVQQQQVEGRKTRGGILEFALDAEDVLKQEDQGVSFYEFVRLILSPAETQKLERIIQEIRRIPELAGQQDGLETVRGMITLLQREAEKVMRTNQRLSTTLRRLLDARAHAERQRVAQLLREIQGLAASLASDPPRDEVGLAVQVELDVESPFRRTFWTEPPRLETIDLADFEADEEQRRAAFRQLAEMHRLDWRSMRNRIRAMTSRTAGPTLGELLEAHPPQAGVIEVLGYLQIARDDGHLVNSDARERVLVPPSRPDGPWIEVTAPLVTFVRTAEPR